MKTVDTTTLDESAIVTEAERTALIQAGFTALSTALTTTTDTLGNYIINNDAAVAAAVVRIKWLEDNMAAGGINANQAEQALLNFRNLPEIQAVLTMHGTYNGASYTIASMLDALVATIYKKDESFVEDAGGQIIGKKWTFTNGAVCTFDRSEVVAADGLSKVITYHTEDYKALGMVAEFTETEKKVASNSFVVLGQNIGSFGTWVRTQVSGVVTDMAGSFTAFTTPSNNITDGIVAGISDNVLGTN
jgi:hypothetical protein